MCCDPAVTPLVRSYRTGEGFALTLKAKSVFSFITSLTFPHPTLHTHLVTRWKKGAAGTHSQSTVFVLGASQFHSINKTVFCLLLILTGVTGAGRSM